MSGKIGVVDVGGGLRGVYAAGILDYCLDNGISFDLGIGVSAGSANLASFAAGQPRRNLQFFTEYAMRGQYMGMENFLRRGSYIDLDYVYSTLSNSDGENPLDYPAMCRNPMEMYVVATSALTGRPQYFTKADTSQDNYHIFKASCAIPFVCRPYVVRGIPYYDGALGDPVPVEKAFSLGCEKVVVILTRPVDWVRTSDRDKKIAARIRRPYPLAAEGLEKRAERYNAGVALARQYAAQGKALILAPDDTCGVTTLSKDVQAMHRLYEKGCRDGKKIAPFLAQTTENQA